MKFVLKLRVLLLVLRELNQHLLVVSLKLNVLQFLFRETGFKVGFGVVQISHSVEVLFSHSLQSGEGVFHTCLWIEDLLEVATEVL